MRFPLSLLAPLFQNDIIPPNDPAPTPPAPPTRTNRVTCDFCGCQLAANGDVLRMSDEAKAMQKASHNLSEVKAELSTVQGKLTEAETALAEAKRVADTLPTAQRKMFEW